MRIDNREAYTPGQVLDLLHAYGFDRTGDDLRPQCSQCEATVVNGFPLHEHRCPHDMHECAGCNNVIPANQRYCDDCA